MDSESEKDFSRTDLAEDRTILANERTFAGWMRTALACVAIGVGFHALFPKLEPAVVAARNRDRLPVALDPRHHIGGAPRNGSHAAP